jgi:Na+-transporting methylmalonyl-CoA/oxaloacetate decarboxylase gamma subunit
VFYNDTFSQHEISLGYFQLMLGEKTLADIWHISCLVARNMVLRKELLWILGAAALLGLLTWLVEPERKRSFCVLGAFLVLSFLVYCMSLMAMYVTSMSLEAALELQSADRYFRIWEIMALSLLAVYSAALTEHNRKGTVVRLVLTVGVIVLGISCYGGIRHIGQLRDYDLERRVRAEAPIFEYGVAPGYSYLICAEDDRVWFPAFLWMFHLDTDDTLQIKVTDESQLAVEKNYDYVVILDENNPIIENWLAKTYPEQVGRTVIQCFK